MTRIVIPIILLAASLGLFMFYINPTYQTVKTLSAEQASYDDALNKSQQLRTLRDQLLATRASFSADDINKLARVLPDNVDNIRLIIDINNIAARHNLTLSQVQLGQASNTAGSGSSLASGPAGSGVGSVQVGFAVISTYDNFLAFEEDLEHSLRVIDVDKISFTAGQNDLNTYTFEIKTYWLH